MRIMTTPSSPLLPVHDDDDDVKKEQAHLPSSLSSSTAKYRRLVLLLLAGGLGMILILFMGATLHLLSKSRRSTTKSTTRIAFIGNSFQFVNDFPRLLAALAEPQNTVEQDSVLHGSLSLITVLKRGNGMRKRWMTDPAWNDTWGVYDVGACTVNQLLVGKDDYLLNNTYDQVYLNDGRNPCFNMYPNNNYANGDDDDSVVDDSVLEDDDGVKDDDDRYYQSDEESERYLEYTLETKMTNDNKTWNYVVFNDHSVRPAVVKKRNKTSQVLNGTYLPLLEQCGATPVFISTYGYWRDNLNLTHLYGIQDVPHFTAKLYKGYQTYAQILVDLEPRVAPVGIAFLVVWEENPDLWYQLFGPDQYHPSPLGSYLMGCVVHATIFGTLPKAHKSTTGLYNHSFAHARSMGLGEENNLPTVDEARYLRGIAQRVVFRNYRPPSFREAWEFVLAEEDEME